MVAACRQLVGIDDEPPTALTATVCGLPYGTPQCASCASTKCCDLSTACAADTVCDDYESCLGKCLGDPGCRSQCTTNQRGATLPSVSALSACLASNCEDECGLACGAVAAYVSPPDAAASCQHCVAQSESSCASATACGSDVACDAYLRCLLTCPTPDCGQACASSNPEGASLFSLFQPDPNSPLTYGSCSVACGAGMDWSCIGMIGWPHPHSPDVTLTLKIDKDQTALPIVGLNVNVCAGCPCPSPDVPLVGQGTTDDAGLATITFPNPPLSGDLGLDGCLEFDPDPGSGIVPEFSYWGFPFSEAQSNDTNAVNLDRAVTVAGLTQDVELLLGVPPDFNQAPIVQAIVHDCLGSTAPGVQIALTPDGPAMPAAARPPEYYVKGIGATLAATETDTSGVAGFINVAPGAYTLTGTVPGVGVVSRLHVLAQAGTVTGALLFPTPATP